MKTKEFHLLRRRFILRNLHISLINLFKALALV